MTNNLRMKITKLVLYFNKQKILLGLLVASLTLVLGFRTESVLKYVLIVFGALILINILLSIYASYVLYDQSVLYKAKGLVKRFSIKETEKILMFHASFDPVSVEIERELKEVDLDVYNIYGNRHQVEGAIEVSDRIFPPNPRSIDVKADHIPCNDETVDVILALTALHEIFHHDDRVKFFKEMKRVLKEDGRIIICEQMRDLTNFIHFNIGAFHFLSMSSWEKAISESGLAIKNIEALTRFATIIHLERK